jgi:hypothetical protein
MSDNLSYGRPTQKSAARDGANTAPYQSCHRDNYLPTTRIGIRMAAPGNAFYLNRRAVSKNATVAIGLAPYLDKFLMTTKISFILTVNADAHSAP